LALDLQNARLSLVPPRNCEDQSIEDAILDIVGAGREDVKLCLLVEKPASRRSR
jgi:hypothetical protein